MRVLEDILNAVQYGLAAAFLLALIVMGFQQAGFGGAAFIFAIGFSGFLLGEKYGKKDPHGDEKNEEDEQ